MDDLKGLDKYPFSGHGVIMGKHKQSWQNSDGVLSLFGKRVGSARRAYRAFVAKGMDQGRREDLTGGGLIRSTGGWAAVKELRKAKVHVKSDERILGDGDFVDEVLSKAEESFERRNGLKAKGVDVEYIADRVGKLLDIPVEDVWSPGRYRNLVAARSLICFWAVRELGMSMTSIARRFRISTAAVSKSVKRGEEIAKREGYQLT